MDNKIKLSNYNYFFDYNNNKYVYNVLKGSLVELKQSIWKELQNSINLDEVFIEKLKKLGVIIDKNDDELLQLKNSFYYSKYNDRVANYIIYLTLDCNFSCYYCFEKAKRISISKTNKTSLEKFINLQIPRLNKFTIRWSGGEPLLQWNMIKELSEGFIKISNKNRVKYEASMATNGYFLTEEIARDLKRYQIKNLTITIDGPSYWHNKVRNDNNQNSFSKIVSNIKIAVNYAKIIVRINFDKRNIGLFEELIKEFEHNKLPKNKITLYLKPIIDIEGKKETKSFTNDKFYLEEVNLIKIAEKYKYNISFHPGFKTGLRCIYYHINSFAIDPYLNLFKCPEYIGNKEYSIGHIDKKGNPIVTKKNNLLKINSYSPYNIKECKNCKVLPLCSGKCPILYEQNNFAENAGCISEKDNLKDKLKYSINQKFQLQELKSNIY